MKLDAWPNHHPLSLILSGIGLGSSQQHQLNHIQGLFEPRWNLSIHKSSDAFRFGTGFLATTFLMGWVTRQLMAQTIQELLETAKDARRTL